MCVTKLLSLRQCQHVFFFVQKRVFFYPFRPTVYKYPVTENASFQNALQPGEFRKRQLLIYTWTEENGGFQLQWCQKPINRFLDDIIHHILRMLCEKCYRNSCAWTKAIQICYLWTRVFFFFKIGGIFGYVWRDLKVFPSPCYSLKMSR